MSCLVWWLVGVCFGMCAQSLLPQGLCGFGERFSRNREWGAQYDGPHKTKQEKIESFISMPGKLERGKTYLFVDHPGLDSPELRAIHHIGYEDVAADRQGVTDLWTSEQVKAAIRKNGIELISYADLK